MKTLPVTGAESQQPTLLLAADHYNRYPSELVTLYLHFSVPEQVGTRLQLAVPRVVQAESYTLPEGVPVSLPTVAESDNDLVVLIPLEERYFTPGVEYDMQIGLRLNTFYSNQYLLVEARLITDEAETLEYASLRLAVFGKGKFLQYLPELYDSDDFMSRFLMLFESFWKPINQQIEQVDNYFDADLTPPTFIPWLSAWLGMPVDESLPLDRQRTLLKSMMMLFQYRGTLKALKSYLEVYTAGEVTIIERRAANFVLGPVSVLGLDIALGRENQPNTVIIDLRLSESELTRTKYSSETYRQKMMDIVRTLVPAQVYFDVNCKFE
jgi:phage tail protein domain